MALDYNTLNPQDQSEYAVLAGIIFDNNLIDEVTLVEDDFYQPSLAKAYKVMRGLRERGSVIDPPTMSQVAPAGAALFWDITTVPYGLDVLHHAELVRENSTRRQLAIAALKIQGYAADGAMTIDSITDSCRMAVDEAIGVKQGITPDSGSVVDGVVAMMGKSTPAMPTPWHKLSVAIRGFRPGALYVIGARPGIGKSAIALQVATKLEHHGHVGFFTLEMSADEVARRLISQQTAVSYKILDSAQPLPGISARTIEAWREGYQGRILFDDRGVITVAEVRAAVRTWSRDHQLSAIVVDYLQLMSGPAHMKKLEIVTEISRQLKLLARDFNVPVIALSQLNRQSEHRSDKVPALSDLRESGAIEQDADVVLLLHRDMSLTVDAGHALEVIVAKNRQGPTGTITLDWQGEYMRAVEPKEVA